MNKNSKSFAPILIVVILGVIGIIGYLVLKRPSPPTPTLPTSSPSQAQITNWKTYRSGKHSFEFKYPPDWEVAESSVLYPSIRVGKYGPTQKSTEFGDDITDGAAFTLAITNLDDQAIKNIVEKYGEPILINFQGWKGYRAQKTESGGQVKIEIIQLINQSTPNFIAAWYHKDPSGNSLNAQEYFFPILSTFKFLEQ